MKRWSLQAVEKALLEKKMEIGKTKTDYAREVRKLESELNKLEERKLLLMQNVDIGKIEKASKYIKWSGLKCFSEGEFPQMHKKVKEDFITGNFKIKREYFGAKDYAGFSCQGVTCRYGYGPTHGSVVISMGATREWRKGEIPDPTGDDLDAILYTLNIMEDEKIRKSMGGQ